MKEITVNINGKIGLVDRQAFVEAKTKQLIEFGYPSLTEKEVDGQIDALLAKKELGEGLTVIGMMMEDEIILPS